MREILFRGKRIDKGEWAEGYFVYCKSEWDDESGRTAEIIPHETDRIYKGEYNPYDVYEVDLNTVGQFTGLTDKNGKRIFEGDILSLRTGKPHLVKFEEGGFVLTDTAIPFRYADKFEVIGNIHDNPELIKEDS